SCTGPCDRKPHDFVTDVNAAAALARQHHRVPESCTGTAREFRRHRQLRSEIDAAPRTLRRGHSPKRFLACSFQNGDKESIAGMDSWNRAQIGSVDEG